MRQVRSISIIIPVFNSENCIGELLERLMDVSRQLDLQTEIIAVDDGSSDNSWEVLKGTGAQSLFPVKRIRLSRNFGQHHALICGMSKAKGDVVITIDDDLEFLPEDIPVLLERYLSGNSEVVYGVPQSKKISAWRKFQSFCYKKLAGWVNKSGVGSSFRLLSSSLVKEIVKHSSPFIFIDELCLWYTDKVEVVQVRHELSKRSRSNYNSFKLVALTSNLILISSTFPLKLITRLGFILMLTNFFIGFYIIIQKMFFSIKVLGYTSLIVSILFSTGIILFSLGIIAQYVSKILLSQYGKPSYHIAEEI